MTKISSGKWVGIGLIAVALGLVVTSLVDAKAGRYVYVEDHTAIFDKSSGRICYKVQTTKPRCHSL